MIGFVSFATHAVIPLEFSMGDEVLMVTVPAIVTVTASETNACLAELGFGLMQAPRYRVAGELAAGKLVEVLSAWPPTSSPVFLLYPEGRQLSPRVRLFIDWAAAEVARSLAEAET